MVTALTLPKVPEEEEWTPVDRHGRRMSSGGARSAGGSSSTVQRSAPPRWQGAEIEIESEQVEIESRSSGPRSSAVGSSSTVRRRAPPRRRSRSRDTFSAWSAMEHEHDAARVSRREVASKAGPPKAKRFKVGPSRTR
jgi:hypothetical protein